MHQCVQTIITIFTLIGLVGAASTPARVDVQENKPEEIVLTEGTPINVVTTQEITSKAAKPNDPVNFTVDGDLMVNGQVVVRKGTTAIGSVINAERGGYLGKSGKLGIQVISCLLKVLSRQRNVQANYLVMNKIWRRNKNDEYPVIGKIDKLDMLQAVIGQAGRNHDAYIIRKSREELRSPLHQPIGSLISIQTKLVAYANKIVV